MAKQIVQLSGGPDGGVELAYNVPPPLPNRITYSGSVYDNAHRTKDDGTGLTVHVFTYDAARSSGVPAPKLHGGWNRFRRTMNKQMPSSVEQARRDTRAALRAVHRGSKVKT